MGRGGGGPPEVRAPGHVDPAPTGSRLSSSSRFSAQRNDPSGKVKASVDELHPRRPGHDPRSCDTCERADALTTRWHERELRALRDRRRVIDLRES
jgi:hypothetical protein